MREEEKNLEVLVISLGPRPESLLTLREFFPQAESFPAIDLRGASPLELLHRALIDLTTLETLEGGRKEHWQICSTGAVGLRASSHAALLAGEGPLLLCEEDCLPEAGLDVHVRALLSAQGDFDAAVFGPVFRGEVLGYLVQMLPEAWLDDWLYSRERAPLGWGRAQGPFERTHCVLYSAEGRKRAARLFAPPHTLQTDGLLALGAKYGLLRVLLKTGPSKGASQAWHISTVQDVCLACLVPSNPVFLTGLVSLTLLTLAFLTVTIRVAALTRR